MEGIHSLASGAGNHAFSDLQRQFADTTRKMLTQQLRELEADGLVHREVYQQVPPKVEYSLTEKGKASIPSLQ